MISHIQALKARFNLVGRESVMRRAFSARRTVTGILGRCPRLKMSSAFSAKHALRAM